MVRRIFRHWLLALVLVLLLVFAVPPLVLSLLHHQEASDSDPGRGAATVAQDAFGDSFTKVAYLEQNWQPQDSLWFYTTTQGSNLLPYDFFMALEQPGDKQAECRPATFQVGSREFDPVKVGLRSGGYDGFTFDTRLPGNSNAGHEYGSVAAVKGDKTVPPLTREDRLDLLDYLKAQ
ncbi:hypothetical protein F2P44_29405 [Massilia sp. CCM 8695]|uniref:Cytochrome C n=1 Tax=Massilia frigida TaxID=2609281 RepID=A0ABX0NJN0_9BURK|nr:hypothetical protein [Massilia frigida]NHZ83360.1 hypothetical protein [Massilia frigida]